MSVKFYSMPKLKANQIIEEVQVTRERKKVQKEYGKTNWWRRADSQTDGEIQSTQTHTKWQTKALMSYFLSALWLWMNWETYHHWLTALVMMIIFHISYPLHSRWTLVDWAQLNWQLVLLAAFKTCKGLTKYLSNRCSTCLNSVEGKSEGKTQIGIWLWVF